MILLPSPTAKNPIQLFYPAKNLNAANLLTLIRMPFEPITHVKINKSTGAPISKKWIGTYKSILNKIATGGIDTKEKLISDSDEVLLMIDTLFPETDSDDTTDEEKQKTQDKARTEKRLYYSAVFYALDEYTLEFKKPYYDAFQKAKQNAPPNE